MIVGFGDEYQLIDSPTISLAISLVRRVESGIHIPI